MSGRVPRLATLAPKHIRELLWHLKRHSIMSLFLSEPPFQTTRHASRAIARDACRAVRIWPQQCSGEFGGGEFGMKAFCATPLMALASSLLGIEVCFRQVKICPAAAFADRYRSLLQYSTISHGTCPSDQGHLTFCPMKAFCTDLF